MGIIYKKIREKSQQTVFDMQAERHRDRHTDTLIAILHPTIGDKVINVTKSGNMQYSTAILLLVRFTHNSTFSRD